MEKIDNICGWLNEIMVYSVNTGLIPASPLSGIKKPSMPLKLPRGFFRDRCLSEDPCTNG